jgi:methylenetetrahydrofolate reductase (NADPH)
MRQTPVAKTLQKPGTHLSFEFYPPKEEKGFEPLYDVMEQFKIFDPDYYSITWGAGGSTIGKSLDIADAIANRIQVNCVSHFTGLGMTPESVEAYMKQFRARNICNILVLRGDVPHHIDKERAFEGGFKYASDLVKYIRSKEGFDPDRVSLLVAGCPEGHPDAASFRQDMDYLAAKVHAGGEAIVTQFFFDNQVFYRFIEAMSHRGVQVPISVGLMLITKAKMIKKMLDLSPNCTVPGEVREAIERYQNDDDSMEAFGVDFATKQLSDLVEHGHSHIHFYTLNRYEPTAKVLTNLHNIL